MSEKKPYLCNGMRFKVGHHESYGVAITGLPLALNGRWVALVAADDDCHRATPPASHDAGESVTTDDASAPAWTSQSGRRIATLTDEQVREIAEKWASEKWRYKAALIEIIEAAIREAMGRGERG